MALHDLALLLAIPFNAFPPFCLHFGMPNCMLKCKRSTFHQNFSATPKNIKLSYQNKNQTTIISIKLHYMKKEQRTTSSENRIISHCAPTWVFGRRSAREGGEAKVQFKKCVFSLSVKGQHLCCSDHRGKPYLNHDSITSPTNAFISSIKMFSSPPFWVFFIMLIKICNKTPHCLV